MKQKPIRCPYCGSTAILKDINESGQIYIQNGDTQEIKDHFDYFPPRNYWDVLITLFQKEDLTAKETDQALELSWIKE